MDIGTRGQGVHASEIARVLSCHSFKLELPNVEQKRKAPWLRSLLS